MTDEPDTHEEIARLLRERGPVEAPPDLARSVMDEVRRTPRRTPRHREAGRRAAGWAAAAAALVALGFGISRIDLGGGSSSSGSSAGGSAAAGEAGALQPDQLNSAADGVKTAPTLRPRSTYLLSVGAAKRLLGDRYSQADAADGRIVLVLDADQYRAYVRRFRGHVAAKGESSSGADGRITVILRRAP
ncbi:MAG: hypothetical protein ACJ740_12460 [Gaiellales bacterium]|jgi:hypothetical protein